MLQSIRERTQGWIAGAIISVIILTFALWGIHSYFTGGAGNQNVAKVNHVDISQRDLSRAYDRLSRQIMAQTGKAITQQQQAVLKQRALKALVEVEALKQASYNQGFRVFEPQVEAYLQSMSDFQDDGEFSLERFQSMLVRSNMSAGQFMSLIQSSLLIDQPRLGLVLSSLALPEETTKSISLIEQKRDVAYFTLPIKHFLTNQIHVTDKQIKDYYQAHKDMFMTPETVKVKYLELDISDIEKQISATPEQLQAFYNDNQNAFTKPQRWKLAEVVIPVDATKDDADANALREAEDISAAVNKGQTIKVAAKKYAGLDLSSHNLEKNGWMRLQDVPADLQAAVAPLTQKGRASDPVKTEQGYVVVRVLDFENKHVAPYASVKAGVLKLYRRQHAEERFAEAREHLADVAFESPDSLKPAADALALKIQTSDYFGKDKNGDGIAQFEPVRRVAFSHDVLVMGNNSDVVLVSPDKAVVLRVEDHKESSLQSLAKVKDHITKTLREQLATDKAKETASTLMTKLQEGGAFKKLAYDNKFEIKEVPDMGRYSTKVDTAIVDKAFSLPEPNGANSKPVYAIASMPNAFAVIAVKSVKPGALDSKKKSKVFAEQFANSEGMIEYELYKQSQLKQAKITYLDHHK